MGEKLHLSYTLDACAWTRATNPRRVPKVATWGPSPPNFFLFPSRNVPLRSRPQTVTLTLVVRIFTTTDVGAELEQI